MLNKRHIYNTLQRLTLHQTKSTFNGVLSVQSLHCIADLLYLNVNDVKQKAYTEYIKTSHTSSNQVNLQWCSLSVQSLHFIADLLYLDVDDVDVSG